jgi:glycosyltransferase involved in cell wall biosynthesis
MMNQKPIISIITPSYNQARFIERTIRSVLSQQSPASVEHLVIDGGSDDGTIDILKKYNSSIRWISEKDTGQSDALNKGIGMSAGSIIGWLNSDDIYLPGALSAVAEYFEKHPDCHWLYGRCRIIDENDRETRSVITGYKNLVSRRFSFNLLLIENFISQPAVFFRKSAFEQAGPLDTSLPLAMDYDLWIRLAKLGKPGVINRYLAGFRVHREAKSAQYTKRQFGEQLMIHKRHDHRWWLLLLHRVNVVRTVLLYWFLNRMKR